jgi:hypothetical protein
MSVSSLENPAIGHKFGLAYLSDVVVAGGVSSITTDDDVVCTGALTIGSTDETVVVTGNATTGLIDLSVGAVASGVLSIDYGGEGVATGAVVLESSDSSVVFAVGSTPNAIDITAPPPANLVSAIGYGVDGSVSGDVFLESSDGSIVFSAGTIPTAINISAPIPAFPQIIPYAIDIAVGDTATASLSADNNNTYFYITKTTASDPAPNLYTVNFAPLVIGDILPQGFTIFIKNSIPYDAVIENDVKITQEGDPILDIAGTGGIIHRRGNVGTINTAFCCLTVLGTDGKLTLL